MQLAIWYNSSKKAGDLAEKISKDFGVRANAYQVDVRDYSAVEAAVAKVVEDFGRLDVMITNAGIPTKAGGLDDRVEDWNNVRAVDFDGAYYCLRAAGLVFRNQRRGVAVVTASMSGHAANVPQEQSCYNACKAGVVRISSISKFMTWLLIHYGERCRFIWRSLFRWSGRSGEAASTPSHLGISTPKSRATAPLR